MFFNKKICNFLKDTWNPNIFKWIWLKHFFFSYLLFSHSMEKWKIYCQWKKFRQINSLVTSLVVIFTKFLPRMCNSKFPYFIHCGSQTKWKFFVKSSETLIESLGNYRLFSSEKKSHTLLLKLISRNKRKKLAKSIVVLLQLIWCKNIQL